MIHIILTAFMHMNTADMVRKEMYLDTTVCQECLEAEGEAILVVAGEEVIMGDRVQWEDREVLVWITLLSDHKFVVLVHASSRKQ